MFMNINSFSTNLYPSNSICFKTNEVYKKSEIQKEKSKKYSGFDNKTPLVYDKLTTVWEEGVGEFVVLNVNKSLTTEKQIERVSRNYFYMVGVVYGVAALVMLVTLMLLFEAEITIGEFIFGIFSGLAFSAASTKVLNESKKGVVFRWRKIQNPKQ